MKKFTLLSLTALLTIAIIIGNLQTSQTHPSAPDWGYTGAPSENTCGKSSCHNNTPNSGAGTLSITFDSQFYIPGNTYVVTVSTDEAGMARFGFETNCLDASNVKQGSAALINTTNTSLNTTTLNRWYVGHKSAGATKTWTFNWTAPATNAGDLTFYVAALCANNNSNSTGDHCYTTSAIFQPQASAVNTVMNSENNFQLIQNPVIDKIIVSYNNYIKGKSLIRLLDLNGRVLKILLNEEQNTGSQTSTFLAPETSGLYLIDYSNGNNHTVKKVLVL
ncbi:MAG: T9SS C-terminal target domain-containing protein [Sphingobacteriales bacterium]|nr:MAG: T9SS C-terminal target domain-containing protein [Sphingobacteriales bacterium]